MPIEDRRSSTMRLAVELCDLYAPLARPIVLVGPVGSGKTTLAARVHRSSGVPGAFVPVSMGELTEGLFASTLFGHRPGAFTGAGGGRQGALTEAASGTLLIDDLALMPLFVQAALVRVLEGRRYRPLGAERDRALTARLVFASTIHPRDLVSTGLMLPDVESRLGELVVRVPSLSERAEEIERLATDLARTFLTEHRCDGTIQFTGPALAALRAYCWPGNVRELKGVVERAVVHAGMSSSTVLVGIEHLPERVTTWKRETRSGPALTRELVDSVLKRVGGNRSEAARVLGVHRNTVSRYLSAHSHSEGGGEPGGGDLTREIAG